MTIDDNIGDEKLHYDINREAAMIYALSSDKTDNNEYLTREEILPSNRRTQNNLSLLILYQESLRNINKKIEGTAKKNTFNDRVEKEVLITDQKSISDLFSKYFLAAEVRDELNKIREKKLEINIEII